MSPQEVFRAALENNKACTLVIMSRDPRMREEFREFRGKDLKELAEIAAKKRMEMDGAPSPSRLRDDIRAMEAIDRTFKRVAERKRFVL